MSSRRVRHDTLFEALAAVQAEVREVVKTIEAQGDDGDSFVYASLPDVAGVAFEVLKKHRVEFAAWPTMRGDRFVLRYRLRLEGAQTASPFGPREDVQKGSYPLPNPQASPQVLGAAITSARRHLLQTIAGITSRADESATQTAPPPPAAPAYSREKSLETHWISFMTAAVDRERLDIGKEGAQSMDSFTDKVQAAYLARAGVLAREAEVAAEAGAA